MDTATELEAITFPLKGNDYVPLPRGHEHGGVQGHAVQTIDASPEHIFAIFNRYELLPSWQDGVVQVTATGDRTAHWIFQDPGTGKQIEYDSEITESIPGQLHVSRIVNGPFEGTTDTLTLAPHPTGRGTTVTWVSDFKLPGGLIANAVAALASRTPEQMLIENLRHLKQLIETGEIPSVEGQPAGPRGVMGKWKQWLMGETLPTPPGTSERAKPQDMPQHDDDSMTSIKLGSVVVLAGALAWYGMRRLLES